MSSRKDPDLIIIGGGPGGYGAALYAANAGMKVVLVEKDRPGGTCLLRGCIPSKAFLETAHIRRSVAEAHSFGIGEKATPLVEFAKAQARKQEIVDGLVKGLTGLLKSRKVERIAGTGRVTSVGEVEIVEDGRTLRAKHVLLAAGSVPRTLDVLPPDGEKILTSDHVLDLTELPKRAAIIGAGVVGLEFASWMADLGVEVVLLEANSDILPTLDSDISRLLVRGLKSRGVEIRTGVDLVSVTPSDAQVTVETTTDKILVDKVVSAVGRRPATAALFDDDLEIGLDDAGAVVVDQRMRTTRDNFWAVGDITSTPQLAHVAFAEAMVAVKDMLGENPAPIEYDRVPWCIYTHPEVAWVGLSEQAAKTRVLDVEIRKEPLAGNGRARIIGESEGLIKVVARRSDQPGEGEILGVHMTGPWVTEQITAPYLAINWEAAANDIAPFVFPHPSFGEALGEAFISLTGRGLHLT